MKGTVRGLLHKPRVDPPFFARRRFGIESRETGQRVAVDIAANRLIFRRGWTRGIAHWLIMWGCLLAAAITFPLVWGWVQFETAPSRPLC